MRTLTVARRFNGPSGSGNGGVVAGMLAAHLPAAATVEVTLRRPPPLDELMRVEVAESTAELFADDALVASARAADSAAIDPVPPVTVEQARAAMAGFEGLGEHPFATCFVCGSSRSSGDGLEVFAGPLAAGRTAAVFVAKQSHRPPDFSAGNVLTWAALDCPGGWAIGIVERPAVLGRMTATVSGSPGVGELCVVVGELDRWDGRKAFSRTTLYGADGRELGRAAATWIELARV
ncbi:MAG: hypothetical protein ACR2KJ_12385 [Jatrophihabitans sp.]